MNITIKVPEKYIQGRGVLAKLAQQVTELGTSYVILIDSLMYKRLHPQLETILQNISREIIICDWLLYCNYGQVVRYTISTGAFIMQGKLGTRYSSEFKESIVALNRSGHSAHALSKEYNVSVSTIYKWINQADSNNTSVLSLRERQLIKENKQLKEELDILKRAAVLLAKN